MNRLAHAALALVLLTGLSLVFVPLSVKADGIVEVVSPGGIRAWLRQDASVPLVAISFRFDGGSAVVPAEKAGLASLSAYMLTEGAGERDSEEIRQVLSDESIGLNFGAGRDSFSGELVTLKQNRALAVSLLRDALQAPLFPEAAFERVRAAMIQSFRRRTTQPNSMAYRAWRETAYAGHPYRFGTQGNAEALAGLTIADVQTYLGKVLTRRSLTVGVAGDISPDELGALLDEAFGGLPDHPPPPPAATLPALPSGVKVVEHPASQSVIVFGHRGMRRSNPDWPAAMVVTQVLGGSTFTSRLGSEIREKRGLAYGVGVGLSPSEAGGALIGRTATRNDAVGQTLSLIDQEWRRLAADGPTADEVADAKAYLIGSFPLGLDSTASIADVLVQMQVYELGLDYWQRRAATFEAVTVEDARRVARELLDADALLSVVVGQPEDVTSSL